MKWLVGIALMSACAQTGTATDDSRSAYLPPDETRICRAYAGAVEHRGACGACSTPRDMRTYRRTRETLTDTATRCAFEHMLLGRGAAARCVDKRIGFTAPCRDCWLDNMACTIERCAAVCLQTRVARTPKVIAGELNACLACDERECGPAFVACAGATRRGAGIETDIERPPEQMWRRE